LIGRLIVEAAVKYNRALAEADQPQGAFTLDARVQPTQSCTTNELNVCVRWHPLVLVWLF